MLSLIFALVLSANAQPYSAHEAVWDARAHKFITLAEFKAAPGDIVVMGEEHAVKGSESDAETFVHHRNQVRLIKQLQKSRTVSVGMEFLIYTFQSLVDQFIDGFFPEASFLQAVHWGSNPFQFYRDQILSTRGTWGRTLALNIPQEIADQVTKAGKDSLTPDQQALTPPFWERGNESYFERFSDAMKEHAPPEAIERYFWAQSLWDDTMAWKALEHQREHPDHVLVIIVGEFHVLFGGGLPYELKKNGAASVKTVLQVQIPDWADSTLQEAIRPDPKYGESADYLWLHTTPTALIAL